MSRRVSSIAAALLALSLVLNAPVASAAAVRDRDGGAGVGQRIIQTIKKVLKPLTAVLNEEDPEYKPTPPKP